MDLVKTYSAATRQDLVDIASNHARHAINAVKNGKTAITNIIGPPISGKSLFWDIALQKLIPNNPKCISQRNSSPDPNGSRVHETWIGHNEELNKEIKIFFCNVRANQWMLDELDLLAIRDGKPENFGDIIILTNAPTGYIPNTIEHCEYQIHDTIETAPQDIQWGKEISVLLNKKNPSL